MYHNLNPSHKYLFTITLEMEKRGQNLATSVEDSLNTVNGIMFFTWYKSMNFDPNYLTLALPTIMNMGTDIHIK